jgi:hypothetical protein
MLFVNEDARGFYEADRNNFQPRVGFAYELNPVTVLRGGFAMYSIPFYVDAVNQTGFSRSTLLVPTLDAGLSFNAISRTHSPGVLEPVGSSPGPATSLGQGVSSVPVERRTARAADTQ